jgi:hypothetical protein
MEADRSCLRRRPSRISWRRSVADLLPDHMDNIWWPGSAPWCGHLCGASDLRQACWDRVAVANVSGASVGEMAGEFINRPGPERD